MAAVMCLILCAVLYVTPNIFAISFMDLSDSIAARR